MFATQTCDAHLCAVRAGHQSHRVSSPIVTTWNTTCTEEHGMLECSFVSHPEHKPAPWGSPQEQSFLQKTPWVSQRLTGNRGATERGYFRQLGKEMRDPLALLVKRNRLHEGLSTQHAARGCTGVTCTLWALQGHGQEETG